MFQVWKQILGTTPTFMPFDDEEIVGRVILYGVEHNAGEGQHQGKTFANVTSMMAAPDQTIPEGIKLWTQEERAMYRSQNDQVADDAPVAAQTAPDVQPGTAGHREHMREACRKWIVYLVQNEVYSENMQVNYENFVNNENDSAKLKEFCTKAETDCKDAFLVLPNPHPESTAGDELPI